MKNLVSGLIWCLVGLVFLVVTFSTVNAATLENKISVGGAIIEPFNFSGHTLTAVRAKRTADMGQKLAFAHSLLNQYWSSAFQNGGLRYSTPGLVPYNTRIRTSCGPAIINNAFYCPADHTIYFDVNFFANEMSRAGQSLGTDGDAAPIVILAHEWGHAIQGLLGIDNDKVEFQADCLAGTFIKYSIEKGVVENGDIEEAAFSLYHSGDDRWSYRHGTSQERVNNFLSGLRGGIPACNIR